LFPMSSSGTPPIGVLRMKMTGVLKSILGCSQGKYKTI
jgi:hypothetical protein